MISALKTMHKPEKIKILGLKLRKSYKFALRSFMNFYPDVNVTLKKIGNFSILPQKLSWLNINCIFSALNQFEDQNRKKLQQYFYIQLTCANENVNLYQNLLNQKYSDLNFFQFILLLLKTYSLSRLAIAINLDKKSLDKKVILLKPYDRIILSLLFP